MSLVVELAQQAEFAIYIVLGLGAVYYLRAFLHARRQLSGVVFGLEREAVQARRSIALSMLFIFVFVAAAECVLVRAVAPALLSSQGGGARPTPAFSLTLEGSPGPVLAPATPTFSPEVMTAVALGTPLPTPASTQEAPVGVGCVNAHVMITEPPFGASVAGPVEVKGSADIPDFAFYTLEINGPSTQGNWQTISAGSAPVSNGVLGAWDTSVYEAGSYQFRLVVYDAAGNSPPPCVIPLTIVAIP